ncbi:MAG TPA: hypothetical protein VNJ08_03585 [Bacteriovoracaceae bacterium]|nr:hypothetical protein [Bacteriovoracaceae bacterium]
MNSTSRLLFSAALGTFGASLFWTGFPVYFTSVTNQNWSLSGIYGLAVFGTLIFTLIGGIWGDRGNYKKLAVRSHLISGCLMGLIILLTYLNLYHYLLFVLPFLYFNFSLGYISESVWLLKSSESNQVKNRIIERTMVTLVSKLLGFSLGPWVFLKYGNQSLYLCLAAFCLTSLMQFHLMRKEPFIYTKPSIEAVFTFKSIFNSPSFILTAFLTGLLSIPLNPLIVTRLSQVGSVDSISMFWFFAGLSGLTATVIMRKTRILDNHNWFIILTVSMSGLLFLIFSANSSYLIVLFASLYVFSSVYFSAKTQIITSQVSKKENLGSSLGSVNFLIDLGVFVGMILGTMTTLISILWIPVILSVLLILRWFSLSTFGFLAAKT